MFPNIITYDSML